MRIISVILGAIVLGSIEASLLSSLQGAACKLGFNTCTVGALEEAIKSQSETEINHILSHGLASLTDELPV